MAAGPGGARARRGDGPDDVPDAPALLLLDRLPRRRLLAADPGRARPRLRHGAGRRRRARLGTPRRRRDRAERDPEGRSRRGRPAPRRRRRPVADRRGARGPRAEAQGRRLPLHDREPADRAVSVPDPGTAASCGAAARCCGRPRRRSGSPRSSPPPSSWPASSPSPGCCSWYWSPPGTGAPAAAASGGRRCASRSRWWFPPTTRRRASRRRSGRSSRATTRSRSSWSTTGRRTAPPTSSRSSDCPASPWSGRRTRASRPPSTPASRAARGDILVLVDGDTRFEPEHDPATSSSPSPTRGRRGVRQRQGRQPARAARALAAHRVRHRGSTSTGACTTCSQCMPTVPGADRGVPPRRPARRRRRQRRHARRGHRPHRWRSCGPAGGWCTRRTRRAWTEAPASLRPAVAAAVPLVLRDACRRCGSTGGPSSRRARAGGSGGAACSAMLLFQVLLPLTAPVDGRLRCSTDCSSSTSGRRWCCGCGFLGVQLLTAAFAFRLDREPLRPLWSLPLQQVVYRQLMYLVVIQSVFTAVYGMRLPWRSCAARATSR